LAGIEAGALKVVTEEPAVHWRCAEWLRKIEEKTIRSVDAPATARLIMGALLGASLWIASAEDAQTAS
jgi:hypothetical protein